MSATKTSYKDNVHILFRLKQDGSMFVGTAGMVAGKTLPNDNIGIQNCIETIGEKQLEIKIRYSMQILYIVLLYTVKPL